MMTIKAYKTEIRQIKMDVKIVLLVLLLLSFFFPRTTLANEVDILLENSLPVLEKIGKDEHTTTSDIQLLFKRLEEMGRDNPEAFVVLGDLYIFRSIGTNSNQTRPDDITRDKAIAWYSSACRHSINANLRLAEMFSQSPQKKMAYILEAAILGDSTSQLKINKALTDGFIFVDENLQKKAERVSFKASASEGIHSWYVGLSKKIVPDSFFSFTTNKDFGMLIGVKILLLGIVGIIVAFCKKIYLFNDKKDIIISGIVSPFFWILLFMDDPNNPQLIYIKIIVCPILILLLLPYAARANSGKPWALLITIPGKSIMACLVLLFALSAVGKAIEVFQNKKDRLTNVFAGLLCAGAAYGLWKLILKTTKSEENQNE